MGLSLSEDTRSEILRLYDLGYEGREIAKALDISRSAVTHLIAARGAANRRTRHGGGMGGRGSMPITTVVDKVVHNLEDQAHVLEEALRRLPEHDIDPEMLEEWSRILWRRGNVGAVIQRLRRIIREKQT